MTVGDVEVDAKLARGAHHSGRALVPPGVGGSFDRPREPKKRARQCADARPDLEWVPLLNDRIGSALEVDGRRRESLRIIDDLHDARAKGPEVGQGGRGHSCGDVASSSEDQGPVSGVRIGRDERRVSGF